MTDKTPQQTITIDELLARWNSDEGKPYKGSLIDWAAYEADPPNIGCMCAQGQVLNLVGGWSPQRLHDTNQRDVDKATAQLLNISTAHAVLLRIINDRVDGAPSIVLTHPEKVLGDQAPTLLAFWRHLDRMTEEQWVATWAARAAWSSRNVAWFASWDSARVAAGEAAAWAAGDAAWDTASCAAGDAADGIAAKYACAEIQGARIMREKGQPFTFLPMFGFVDPEAVLAAEQVVRWRHER